MKVELTQLGTFVPYEPPRPMLMDTMLAYAAITAPQYGALIEPDPLGPVNRIVTLTRDNHRAKSVLCRVPDGADVVVGHDSAPLSRLWTADFNLLYTIPGRDEWYVDVDGRRVLNVPAEETRPPRPPTPEWMRWTWRRRLRAATTGALREQLRDDGDWIAKRLGYHRDDCCGEY